MEHCQAAAVFLETDWPAFPQARTGLQTFGSRAFSLAGHSPIVLSEQEVRWGAQLSVLRMADTEDHSNTPDIRPMVALSSFPVPDEHLLNLAQLLSRRAQAYQYGKLRFKALYIGKCLILTTEPKP